MPPEHARSFAGGAAESILNPVVLVAMIIAIVLILLLPRKYVIVPLFFILFLVPMGQQVVLGGFHFFVFRIIILVGLSRMLLSVFTADVFPGGFGLVDRAFLGCILCMAGAVILLFLNTDALINQVGFLLDYLGGYFLLRYLIRDEKDIFRAMKCLAVLALIVSISMLREFFTQQNIFGLIGGAITPDMREGRVRCQGPFAHALMAGAFGSTLLPTGVLLWKNAKAKGLATICLVAAVLITWTSNSSTSLMSFAAGLLAICMWPMRNRMRTVRWGILFGLAALQTVMKAPIWFLIARVDLTGGSSSYHRAALIDQFVRHFSDWWLIGIRDSGIWGYDLWDAQDQFVNVGETGGLLAFVFLLVMISLCFAKLGSTRKAVEGDAKKEWFVWILGASLFSNIVAFFGVNYFDQMKFEWFALLAMIIAATALKTRAVLEPQGVPIFGHPPLAYSSSSASGTMVGVSRLGARAQVKSTAR